MERAGFFYRELLPFGVLFMVECINVGSSTLYKVASSKGLNYHVFLVYCYAVSSLFLLPLSYFFHRKTTLPSLTFRLLAELFVLGLIGFTDQSLGYKGIGYSSPTLGSAMNNLTPAVTFILAVLLGMEKLRLKSLSSQAKIAGTVVAIAGALVVVLYRGPVVKKMHSVQKSPENPLQLTTSTSSDPKWIELSRWWSSCSQLCFNLHLVSFADQNCEGISSRISGYLLLQFVHLRYSCNCIFKYGTKFKYMDGET